ncbi:hypothetical protein [Acinetobacter towneri]|uniref:hypothetical protein n=1 Tax=Acinetobacter towneri TaxID=202956 RepID=UPI001F15CD35|nr:hypothetical protein [Acinetobacter towneri]UIP24560.1 hypothetical protein LZG54_10460 [Acinetobacter towneri]
MNPKQALLDLQQLQQQYPAAFKRNILFYGFIQSKGMLDDWKEMIPWVLACLIFIPISISLAHGIQNLAPQYDAFQAKALAILAIMLGFMLLLPYVLYQIKHSSASWYQLQQHATIKIAVLILLQAVNFAYFQSAILQGILFFFCISFGFVRFYKENMFRDHISLEQKYCLTQFRRAAYWSYRQAAKIQDRMYFSNKNSPRFAQLNQQYQHAIQLHQQLMQAEHNLCKSIKYIDLDSYIQDKLD